jgi:hypothetical protein
MQDKKNIRSVKKSLSQGVKNACENSCNYDSKEMLLRDKNTLKLQKATIWRMEKKLLNGYIFRL